MVSAISFFKAQNVAVPGPVCNISQKQKCPVARSPQVFGTSQIQGLDFFFRFYLIMGTPAEHQVYPPGDIRFPRHTKTGKRCPRERQFSDGHMARANGAHCVQGESTAVIAGIACQGH